MSLQTRTPAPGKARRAASVGKPKRTKKAATFKAADPKARHTTAQKNARKGAAQKPASTRRHADTDPATISKKEARLTDRSKLRAKRFQEKTASRPRPVEEPQERKARIELSQKPQSRAKKFVAQRTERAKPVMNKKSDTLPTTRREAVKAKIARSDDGRPNFEPRKREKFDPTRPKKRSVAPDTRAANFRAERPVRDRRNDSPAYARDDF